MSSSEINLAVSCSGSSCYMWMDAYEFDGWCTSCLVRLPLDFRHDNTILLDYISFLLPHGNPGHNSVLTAATPCMRWANTGIPTCRDGARRVFTDQADIAFTKREAPWGVGRVAWRVSCILLRTVFEADFVAYEWQFQWINSFPGVTTSRDSNGYAI